MHTKALQDVLRRWRADRMAFRREAILLEDGTPFGEVMEPWQAEDFAALDSGRYRHAYVERPRGHDKTGKAGTEAVTELVLGRPGARLFCVAADADQARLLLEDVTGKFERNPLLRGSVRILRDEVTVKATGSRLRVLSSDEPSAYGLRPDWIAADELAEWRSRGLWDSLWTATGKRPDCRMLVITTAGVSGISTICEEVRDIAEREQDWFFSPRGQCAGWISRAWLEQQRRTLPPHVYARQHESNWVAGAGAWFTVEEVQRVFTDALPQSAGPAAVGVDLGVTRDAAAVALVRYDIGSRLAVVEALETWRAQGGHKVHLPDVQDAAAMLARRSGAPVVLESWQAEQMAQQLARQGVRVQTVQPTAETRRRLFTKLLEVVREARLKCRPHEALRRELLGLELQERLSGWRVDHPRQGHDDHVVAVGLALQTVVQDVQLRPEHFAVFGRRDSTSEATLLRVIDSGRSLVEDVGDMPRGPRPWDPGVLDE